jgi:hypothetical protein
VISPLPRVIAAAPPLAFLLFEFPRRYLNGLAFVNRLDFADPLALRGELVDVPVFVSSGGCCGLRDMRQYRPRGKYLQSAEVPLGSLSIGDRDYSRQIPCNGYPDQ